MGSRSSQARRANAIASSCCPEASAERTRYVSGTKEREARSSSSPCSAIASDGLPQCPKTVARLARALEARRDNSKAVSSVETASSNRPAVPSETPSIHLATKGGPGSS